MADKIGPGSGSGAGAPGDYTFDKYTRLSNNPQLNRMPTNQIEWQHFIQELEKYTRNECNGFIPTFTGFSTDPSDPFVWWQRFGQMVFVQFHFTTGTSNSTSFFISNLPEEITPYSTQLITPFYGLINNGSEVIGSVRVNANNTISFSTDTLQASGFATIGDKGLNSSPTLDDQLSIIYCLREPNKT